MNQQTVAELVVGVGRLLTGVQAGPVAALYGSSAGASSLLGARRSCSELLGAVTKRQPPETTQSLVRQLAADIQTSIALGSIGEKEAHDIEKLMNNLWNQMDMDR